MFKYLIYPQSFQYAVFKMKVSAGLGRFNFSEIKTLNCFAGGSSHATQPHRALGSFGSPLQVILLDLSQITPTAWQRLKWTVFMSWNNDRYSQHLRIYIFTWCRLQQGKSWKNFHVVVFTRYFRADDRHVLLFQWCEKISALNNWSDFCVLVPWVTYICSCLT